MGELRLEESQLLVDRVWDRGATDEVPSRGPAVGQGAVAGQDDEDLGGHFECRWLLTMSYSWSMRGRGSGR